MACAYNIQSRFASSNNCNPARSLCKNLEGSSTIRVKLMSIRINAEPEVWNGVRV